MYIKKNNSYPTGLPLSQKKFVDECVTCRKYLSTVAVHYGDPTTWKAGNANLL